MYRSLSEAGQQNINKILQLLMMKSTPTHSTLFSLLLMNQKEYMPNSQLIDFILRNLDNPQIFILPIFLIGYIKLYLQHKLTRIYQKFFLTYFQVLKNKYIINLKMFSLKISYKGKNILLGKGISGLKKIDEELAARFPGQFLHGALLKYQDNIITEFDQIEAIASTLPNKSIKLEAEQAPEIKKQSIIKQNPKQEVKEEAKIVEVKQTEQNQEKKQHVSIEEKKQDQALLDQKISIDSQSSDEQPEKKVEKIKELVDPIQIQIKQKPQQVKLLIDDKIENIQNQPVLNDTLQVKCTIFNEVPKQEQVKSEIIKCSLLSEKQNKPQIVKCQIFGSEQPSFVEGESKQEFIEEYPGDKLVQNEVCDEKLQEISPGIFKCIFCKFPFQNCYVCQRSRQISQNSKIMKLINNIVQKKINQKISELQTKFLEKIKSFEKNIHIPSKNIQQSLFEISRSKREIKPKHEILEKQEKEQQRIVTMEQKRQMLKRSSCQIIDNHSQNKKEVLVGESFLWTFDIKFNQFEYSHNACVLDERQGSLTKTQISKSNTITVGPFKAGMEGRFDRTFRFCFQNPDKSIQMFGPKFGLSVNATKAKNTKVLSNSFRIHVEQLKKGYKIERSVEYLIQKLKQLGINEENFQQSKEFLPDIIQTV